MTNTGELVVELGDRGSVALLMIGREREREVGLGGEVDALVEQAVADVPGERAAFVRRAAAQVVQKARAGVVGERGDPGVVVQGEARPDLVGDASRQIVTGGVVAAQDGGRRGQGPQGGCEVAA